MYSYFRDTTLVHPDIAGGNELVGMVNQQLQSALLWTWQVVEEHRLGDFIAAFVVGSGSGQVTDHAVGTAYSVNVTLRASLH